MATPWLQEEQSQVASTNSGKAQKSKSANVLQDGLPCTLGIKSCF